MSSDLEYRWLTPNSKKFLFSNNEYIEQGMTVDDRITIVGETAERILGKPGFARKFKDYFKRGWMSLSTPIWTNFGNDRGLPISCYNSYIEDDSESICFAQSEMSIMSKLGGGTSAYFGELRGRGSPIKGGRIGFSGGPIPFIETFDTNISVWSQGSTRRGSFSPYIDVYHPDIMEFLEIKMPGNKLQDVNPAVCVPDDWLKQMIAGDTKKRTVWAKVHESRKRKGYPYILFTDTVNRYLPKVYKDKNRKVFSSNLCIETTPVSNKDESFVCDLSSANLYYYPEWKDTDLLEVLVYLLDAVATEFIQKASKYTFMKRAVAYAEKHRSLGVGRFGWHGLLQKLMIPFESMEAKRLNVEIAKNIQEKTLAASQKMAIEYGEPEMLKGYGQRHTLLCADAPTTSSAFIIGEATPSNEPDYFNYGVKNLAKGKYTYKNRELEKLLIEKGQNTDEVWKGILQNGGSVQHLTFLSPAEKEVFKIMKEISPMEIITQAAQRQRYIDQGQSINVIIDPSVPTKEVNKFVLTGWEMEMKSFYYQYNENAAQQLGRSILTCSSCEG